MLRASHVGGMFDARLEIGIYRLLDRLKRPHGPWIGAPVKLSEQAVQIDTVEDELLRGDAGKDVLLPTRRAAFEPFELPGGPRFLSIKEGTFLERTQTGDVISEVLFEYVAPQHFSSNTVVVLPVVKTARGTFVGIELRDLPAVQSFTGSSSIICAPSWRLPRSVRNVGELPAFIAAAMRREFALAVQNAWELGGPYFSSPGVTPEVVYPLVVEIAAKDVASSPLHFVDCPTLTRNLDHIHDAHLIITAYRLRHVLGF